MPKKLDLDEALLRKLHEQDATLYQIAAALGCHKGTVERRCRLLGLSKARTGPKNGERHPNWRGGRTIRKGYAYLYRPEHPSAIRGGYVAEHRLVMEEKLGRYLRRSEVVHHADGNPANNAPDNLVVFQTNALHLKHELTGRVPNWTPEGWARMCAPRGKRHQQGSNAQRHNQSADHLTS